MVQGHARHDDLTEGYAMDLRPKELDFTLGGATYALRCNFAVLADVDYIYGGVKNALNAGSFYCALTFLTAMINDANRRDGSKTRYTTAQVSAMLEADYNGTAVELVNDVNALVFAAVLGSKAADDNTDDPAEAAEEDTPKN